MKTTWQPSRGLAAAVAVGVLLSSMVTAEAAAATGTDSATGAGFPGLPKPRDVPVSPVLGARPFTESPVMRDAFAATASAISKPVAWPTAGRRQVSLGRADEGIWVSSAEDAAARSRPTMPAAVDVQVFDQALSRRSGLSGFLFTAARGDTTKTRSDVRVTFDYSGFAHAYGGDWASRLQVIALPSCVLTTPEMPECTVSRPLASMNNQEAETVAAALPVDAGQRVYAVTAGPESSTGDYAATTLSPSASWSGGGSSGDFTWSYPLRVPPSGGPNPRLAFQYSAQAVDGRTSATNNQASWAGEGFEFGNSYVERKYASCDQEGHTGKFDLCWKYDNALLVLNGKANELVRSSGGTNGNSGWRLKNDDGSRVEKIVGTVTNYDSKKEYWRVTTRDGTQYYFGRHQLPTYPAGTATESVWTVPVASDNAGEPCYNSAGFASSFCYQAWRWNLDYVVDPHGNAMTYWYTRELNYYAKNGVASPGTVYARSGYLTRIDYGLRESNLTYRPYQVAMTSVERCLADCSVLDEANKSHWPDVPFDQICDAGKACTNKLAPTFFSRKRLYQIVTKVWKGSAYQNVDFWQTGLQFPSPGDGSAGAAMWLAAIAHKGTVGTEVAVPTVYFTGSKLINRVDAVGGDGLNGLIKFRIGRIKTESGADIQVNYAPRECVSGSNMPAEKDNNSKRCFPVRWTPPREVERLDWFHKYVVEEVRTTDTTGNGEAMVTKYVYSGGAAWHYQETALLKEKDKTWNEWRGYGSVTTLTGDPANPGPRSKSTATYFRGMDGDKLEGTTTLKNAEVRDSEGGVRADAAPLAGQVREQITFQDANSTAEISGTITDYFRHQTAAYTVPFGVLRSHYVATSATKSRVARDGGRPEMVRTVVTDYDTENGLPVSVNDYGDSSKTDEMCTLTSYAKNRTEWLMQHVSRVVSSEGLCGANSANPPADRVLSDERTLYDSGAFGAVPTKGAVTGVQRLNYYDTNGAAQYQTTATNTYDGLGRITSVKDAIGRTTTTAYTPATTWGMTQTVVTQPPVTVATGSSVGFTTRTTYQPEWALPAQVVDPNGKVTDQTYDGLGRLTGVYLPSHPKSGGKPNLRYAYSFSQALASSVRTDKLNVQATGYLSSYALFDSLLRPRQTQTPGANGGRVITETRYDSRGLVSFTNRDVWNSAVPSGSLLSIPNASVPSETMNTYDGAGRITNEAFRIYAVTKWSTSTRYGGDSVTVLPPTGAAATTTFTDVRGQVAERWEYDGNTTAGSHDTTRYTHDLAGRMTQLSGSGGTWTYGYDLQGRQNRNTDPDSGTTTSSYDGVDRLVSTTDSEQNKLIRGYDALDRKTTLHKTDTADANLQASWSYDETGMYGQQYSATRYTTGKAGPYYRTSVVTRNTLYKPTMVHVRIPNTEGVELDGTYQTNYGYNPDAQTLNFTSFSGGGGLGVEDVSVDYNAIGLPTKLYSSNATYVSGIQYTPLGDPERYSLGWNSNMYLANIYEDGTRRLHRATAGDELIVADHVYSYDPAGNVLKDDDVAVGDTQCFDYDGHRRLTEAWTPSSRNCATARSADSLAGPAPYWQSWSYTASGLRRTQVDHTPSGDTTSTYTYNSAQSHTLAQVAITGADAGPAKTFDYDARGNTTSRPGPGTGGQQSLSWSPEGKLSKLTDSQGSTDYVYDAEGALLVRRSPTHTTVFLGELELTLDKSTRQVRGKRQYAINDKVVAVRSANGTPTSDLSWLVSDYHQTSHIAVHAATWQVTRRYATPFGGSRGQQPAGWPEQRGFLGKPEDKQTGLTSVGAREYDSSIGRFLSVDPLLVDSDPQSLLGYVYANSNPTSMADPTGLCPMAEEGGCASGTGVTKPKADTSSSNTRSSSIPKSSGSNRDPGEFEGGTRRNGRSDHDVAVVATAAAVTAWARATKVAVFKVTTDFGVGGRKANTIRRAARDGSGGPGVADVIFWGKDTIFIWEIKPRGTDRVFARAQLARYVEELRRQLPVGDRRVVSAGPWLPPTPKTPASGGTINVWSEANQPGLRFYARNPGPRNPEPVSEPVAVPVPVPQAQHEADRFSVPDVDWGTVVGVGIGTAAVGVMVFNPMASVTG